MFEACLLRRSVKSSCTTRRADARDETAQTGLPPGGGPAYSFGLMLRRRLSQSRNSKVSAMNGDQQNKGRGWCRLGSCTNWTRGLFSHLGDRLGRVGNGLLQT
jgi:hypothetical protein